MRSTTSANVALGPTSTRLCPTSSPGVRGRARAMRSVTKRCPGVDLTPSSCFGGEGGAAARGREGRGCVGAAGRRGRARGPGGREGATKPPRVTSAPLGFNARAPAPRTAPRTAHRDAAVAHKLCAVLQRQELPHRQRERAKVLRHDGAHLADREVAWGGWGVGWGGWKVDVPQRLEQGAARWVWAITPACPNARRRPKPLTPPPAPPMILPTLSTTATALMCFSFISAIASIALTSGVTATTWRGTSGGVSGQAAATARSACRRRPALWRRAAAACRRAGLVSAAPAWGTSRAP
jgi:hypothetical protein